MQSKVVGSTAASIHPPSCCRWRRECNVTFSPSNLRPQPTLPPSSLVLYYLFCSRVMHHVCRSSVLCLFSYRETRTICFHRRSMLAQSTGLETQAPPFLLVTYLVCIANYGSFSCTGHVSWSSEWARFRKNVSVNLQYCEPETTRSNRQKRADRSFTNTDCIGGGYGF
jgi:hypothetical protein